jgi:hypothetical protein
MNFEPLREPEAPPAIQIVVMARIAQLADQPRRPVSDRRRWLEMPAWAASIAGIAVFVASWIAGHVAPGLFGGAPSGWSASVALLNQMPTGLPALTGLTIGTALLIGGLFWRDRSD